jgi:hypothetical protein
MTPKFRKNVIRSIDLVPKTLKELSGEGRVRGQGETESGEGGVRGES